ncbi:MAG: alpha-ketoacid dehydrogenase subunit beta [Caldisericia bacterium]|nr:alpha-ketoacid dehydrogenase subunit beta [Caldisericia bacterium]
MSITYINDLRNGLRELLKSDKTVYLIGEDIGDPYGGAFKVTKGLSLEYPNNIIQTPMSEQGFTGMGIGMALNGLKPIVEIMFGDFITLTIDQIINHLAKFYEVYQIDISFVLRTPSGGFRGYGPTHSQSLERLFFGIPGITVIAPSIINSPGKMITKSVYCNRPIIFIENKLDYSKVLLPTNKLINDICFINPIDSVQNFPMHKITIPEMQPEATIITYGGMVPACMKVQEELLMEEEISTEIITISNLTDIDFTSLLNSIESRKVITIEESWEKFGWGSYITSKLTQSKPFEHTSNIGAKNCYIPAAKELEDYVLPTTKTIYKRILEEIK